MQNTTTRAIENISKGFKGFSRPTSDAIEKLALQKMEQFPATTVEAGPYYKFLDNYRKGKFKFEPSEKNTLGFAFVYVFSKHREKNLELYVRLANENDDNEARQIISDSFIFV